MHQRIEQALARTNNLIYTSLWKRTKLSAKKNADQTSVLSAIFVSLKGLQR
jgi:hypothetical protein